MSDFQLQECTAIEIAATASAVVGGTDRWVPIRLGMEADVCVTDPRQPFEYD